MTSATLAYFESWMLPKQNKQGQGNGNGNGNGSGSDGGGAAKKTIADLLTTYNFPALLSNVEARSDLFPRPLSEVPLSDFFGSVTDVKLFPETYPLGDASVGNNGDDLDGGNGGNDGSNATDQTRKPSKPATRATVTAAKTQTQTLPLKDTDFAVAVTGLAIIGAVAFFIDTQVHAA
jgi:glycosylphosphatidylinositol transamidase (GPIT) subunit GPI8